MYTIFIPKYKDDMTEYLITQVIKLYMENDLCGHRCHYDRCNRCNCCNCCNCIISSPGFMSNTSKTVNDFVYELGNIMSSKHPYIGFFNGMNGHHKLATETNLIRDEHEKEVAHSTLFRPLHICCKPIKDHRKMMFFINYKDCLSRMPDKLDITNYENFLSNCTVCGVLIGSSNQSLTTYFGYSKHSLADKGEADILMCTGDRYDLVQELIKLQKGNMLANQSNDIENERTDPQNNIYRNIRISKSIDEENYTADMDKDYFKGILKDFLKTALTDDPDYGLKS